MKIKGFGKFLSKKLIRLITLLFAVCIATYILMEISPIDPVTAYVGADTKVSAEQRQLIAEHWGLDKPPIERFGLWFQSILGGDWGTSMIYRRPVVEVIGQKFLASLSLMLVAWLISGIIGFILGLIAGVKENSIIDRIICGYCHILRSTPYFWLGILFIMLFSVKLGWFPIGLSVPIGVVASEVTIGDWFHHLMLPALTLGVVGISNICVHTREKVVDILQKEYILFAKARGESKRKIMFRHIIRNVSLPAITLQFLSFSELFGGAVFVEQVFSYPGLGQAVVQAGLKGDAPLLMGIVIFSTIFVFAGNLIADILYWLVDPRIREGEMI